MSDSLNYVDKCLIAAMATMNASVLTSNDLKPIEKVSNTGIDTMKIKTLAEYYNGEPDKIKTYDPSKMDNNKLMRTYVIPIVLDNGETVDLIVNEKGQDMACVFRDKDSNEIQFELTPRMKEEMQRGLNKNGIDGVETKLTPEKIRELIEPTTLNEFTSLLEKDDLIPNNSRDTIRRVKAKDENADIQMENDNKVFDIEDEDNKTAEQIQEEISLEEERLKKIAEKVGMTLDELKKFCKDNQLTSKTIKGAIEVTNVSVLENLLDGTQLNQNASESVVIIKTEENNMQERARVVAKDGETLLDNSKYDDRMVGLVPEYQTTEAINDLDEYTEETKQDNNVEYTSVNGEEKSSQVEGNEIDAQVFEEKINQLVDKYKKALEELNNSDLGPREKSQAKEYMAGNFYADVCNIERETGVVASEINREALSHAEDAVEENEKTKFVEGVKDVGRATGATIGTLTTVLVGKDALMKAAGREHHFPTRPEERKPLWENE